MCVLPLASTGTSPPAFCLNWVQNDNEGSEQATFPWFSGEWSKSYSGLLWATNWNSKSLCHLSLKAVFGRRVWDSIDRLWSPAYGETRWGKMVLQVLKIRTIIKAACDRHERCIPYPFPRHFTLTHCIRWDCCSPIGVLINYRDLIACLPQHWRRPWDIPLSVQLTFRFICLGFAVIPLPTPLMVGSPQSDSSDLWKQSIVTCFNKHTQYQQQVRCLRCHPSNSSQRKQWGSLKLQRDGLQSLCPFNSSLWGQLEIFFSEYRITAPWNWITPGGLIHRCRKNCNCICTL